jgi:hypothetical protein
MRDGEQLRRDLSAALVGAGRGRAVADRLCAACVDLLEVDGAAVSIAQDGGFSRSLGASNALSRELNEVQFTLGEGPALEAMSATGPVLLADLHAESETRWPVFVGDALARGVRAVFALPVSVASLQIGALDLYRKRPGPLEPPQMVGAMIAAELAALPLLDTMGMDLDAALTDDTSEAWDELAALTRVEVYQAAGMLIAQLGVTAAEALVRLRGYAFAHDLTASEVAWEIIERRLRLADDAGRHPTSEERGTG